MNKAKFAELMQFVAIAIQGKELTKTELSAYYFALADEFKSIEQFKDIVKKLLKSWNFSYMPKPAHFIELKKASKIELEVISQKAWDSVVEALKKGAGYTKIPAFEDKLIPAVVDLCGGFERLATKTFEELEWVKKEFIKLYQAALKEEIVLQAKEQGALLENVEILEIKANYPLIGQNNVVMLEDKKSRVNNLVQKLVDNKRM